MGDITRTVRTEGLVLATVLLVAAAARLWQIGTVPPGLYFDEAAYAQDAVEVLAGHDEVFFQGNLGREPLFIYALAGAIALGGPGILPLRLTAVAFGLLSVIGLYLVGRRLFGSLAGLCGAGLLALSFWHVLLSRSAYRVVTLPAVELLAVYAFWTALARRRLWLFALSGALFGLTFYTHLASRFVTPAVLGLALLAGMTTAVPSADATSWPWRRRAAAAALTLLVAVAVTLPLGLYFVEHPDRFLNRAGQVLVGPSAGVDPTVWLDGAARTFGALLFVGDANPRQNLPGRPLFDPLGGACLLVGVAALLARRDRAAGLFALGWLGLGLLPLAITVDTPHFHRSAGGFIAAFLVAGAGLAAVAAWLERRAWSRRHAGALAAVAVVTASGGLAMRDLFVAWRALPETYWATMADAALAVPLIRRAAETGPVYLAANDYGLRAQPQSALDGAAVPVVDFLGERGLVFPPPDAGPVVYVLPRTGVSELSEVATRRPLAGHDVPGWERLEGFFARARLVERVGGPDGQEAIRVYAATGAELQPTPRRSLPARFGDAIALIGYDLPRTAPTAGPLPLVLYWRVLRHAWLDWGWSLTLHDGDGRRLGPTTIVTNLNANAWRPGEAVAGWIDVPPVGAEDMFAYLSLEMAEHGQLGRVRVYNGAGEDVGTHLLLGPIRLGQPASPPADLSGPPTRFGDALELIGYRPGPAQVRPGQTLEVVLVWRALAPPEVDYTVFVHALDAGGVLRAQADRQPREGRAPTSAWEPGAPIVDTVRLVIPPGTPPGRLVLRAGLYEQPSLRRLPTATGDAVQIGTVTVLP
ncbi:MAG TPA: glycosyltransferase family 39 protein [Chloroflexota bacterium]|jgi:4-amino-4-deoxy-L-arabinose transferase-like glycosyltransferase